MRCATTWMRIVGIFGVGALAALRFELGVFGLERVRDVFEKNQAEHDVLVLGRIHVAAEFVGSEPELGFEADVGGVIAGGGESFGFSAGHL